MTVRQNVTFTFTRCIIADNYYDIMTTKIRKVTLPFEFSVLCVRYQQFLVCESVECSEKWPHKQLQSYFSRSQDMSDITRFVLWFNNWMLSELHSATDTNWSVLHHIIMAPATSYMMRKLNSILVNGFLAALCKTQGPWQPYWTRNCVAHKISNWHCPCPSLP